MYFVDAVMDIDDNSTVAFYNICAYLQGGGININLGEHSIIVSNSSRLLF